MRNSIYARYRSRDLHPFLSGSEGTVHSVFSSAINLLFGERIITLLGGKRSALPYSVLLEEGFTLEYLGLLRDDFAFIDKKGIHFSDLFIDIQEASEVELNIVEKLGRLKKPKDMARRLARFADRICNLGLTEGLSVLLCNCRLPNHIRGEYTPNIWSEFLTDKLEEFLHLLAAALASRKKIDGEIFFNCGKALAGCGPGLTPGSDDFLTGIFAGLYAKGLSGEITLKTANEICESMALGAAPKTTFISGQFLHQSGRERLFAQDVIFLIEALYRGDDDRLQEAVERVGNFGSTSGSDIMTGIYYALSLDGNGSEKQNN